MNFDAWVHSGDQAEDGLRRTARQLLEQCYTGIYGDGLHAVVFAYAEALMYQPCAEVHPVPTQCGGEMGFWSKPPKRAPEAPVGLPGPHCPTAAVSRPGLLQMPPRPRDPDTDVVVVGSGISGSLCAYTLCRAGLNVIVLEGGPRLDRGDLVRRYEDAVGKDEMAAYPDVAHAPGEMIQDGPHPYEFTYVRAVGGTTWHWAAMCWRLLPSDFELQSRYEVGRDWPFGYGVLEPYYQRAEEELGVAGPDAEDLGSPRSRPYSMPPVPLSYMDVQIQSVLREAGYRLISEPVARNTIDYDGRPPCCGSNNCMAICPIGAQYSGDVHATKAEVAGARLVSEAVVDRIEVGANRLIQGVRYRAPDGTTRQLTGRAFVIAANGIETPSPNYASGLAGVA